MFAKSDENNMEEKKMKRGDTIVLKTALNNTLSSLVLSSFGLSDHKIWGLT